MRRSAIRARRSTPDASRDRSTGPSPAPSMSRKTVLRPTTAPWCSSSAGRLRAVNARFLFSLPARRTRALRLRTRTTAGSPTLRSSRTTPMTAAISRPARRPWPDHAEQRAAAHRVHHRCEGIPRNHRRGGDLRQGVDADADRRAPRRRAPLSARSWYLATHDAGRCCARAPTERIVRRRPIANAQPETADTPAEDRAA